MAKLAIAGIVSGVLCHFAAEHRWLEDVKLFGVEVVVGLVYALVVGGALALGGAGRSPALLAWGGLVVAAWIAAARVGIEMFDPVSAIVRGRGELVTAGAVGGLVGGAIHSIANTLILPATRTARAFLTVTAVGTLAGASIGVQDELWLLFVLWQGGVAGATGWVVERA